MVMLFLLFCFVIITFFVLMYNLEKIFNYFLKKIKKDKKNGAN